MKLKTKLKIEELQKKFPDIDTGLMLQLYQIGYSEGISYERNRLENFNNLELAKGMIEGSFMAGFIAGEKNKEIKELLK